MTSKRKLLCLTFALLACYLRACCCLCRSHNQCILLDLVACKNNIEHLREENTSLLNDNVAVKRNLADLAARHATTFAELIAMKELLATWQSNHASELQQVRASERAEVLQHTEVNAKLRNDLEILRWGNRALRNELSTLKHNCSCRLRWCPYCENLAPM